MDDLIETLKLPVVVKRPVVYQALTIPIRLEDRDVICSTVAYLGA
jgi:hypothetical protein